MIYKIVIAIGFLVIGICIGYVAFHQPKKVTVKAESSYWFLLERKSNIELLYKGKPGDQSQSLLVRAFHVKAGVPGERPTPLPQLLGKKYWIITKKIDTHDNPETSPYFLELNVPAPSEPPYGPTPYNECDGKQCDWQLPGPFGLHGINGDLTRLDSDNPGSSGCIRHNDQDITYLYNLLNPAQNEIRYYIKDI